MDEEYVQEHSLTEHRSPKWKAANWRLLPQVNLTDAADLNSICDVGCPLAHSRRREMVPAAPSQGAGTHLWVIARAPSLRWKTCMIKSKLVRRLGEQNRHLYYADIERSVATIFREIEVALARGDRV
jgi:hypothetical protein